jgi:hypothetical protein
MSKRVLLSNTIEPDNAGFEQNMAVVLMVSERAKQLLARVERVKKFKAEDDKDLYSMEFWSGSSEYVVDQKLADVILKIAEEEYGGPDADDDGKRIMGEARRIAGLVRAGVPLGQQHLPIEDPEEILAWAMENYDDEAEEADDDTRFDCYTVVVDDTSIQYTALAKHGSGEGIKTARLDVDHLRWLAGEDVKLDEKVEAPRQ